MWPLGFQNCFRATCGLGDHCWTLTPWQGWELGRGASQPLNMPPFLLCDLESPVPPELGLWHEGRAPVTAISVPLPILLFQSFSSLGPFSSPKELHSEMWRLPFSAWCYPDLFLRWRRSNRMLEQREGSRQKRKNWGKLMSQKDSSDTVT